jgi:hypothetical protein
LHRLEHGSSNRNFFGCRKGIVAKLRSQTQVRHPRIVHWRTFLLGKSAEPFWLLGIVEILAGLLLGTLQILSSDPFGVQDELQKQKLPFHQRDLLLFGLSLLVLRHLHFTGLGLLRCSILFD